METRSATSSVYFHPKMLQAKELWPHYFLDFKGQCSYLQLVDEHQAIHCLFVMGKSRVTLLKPNTIPRLELTTAVCSVKISQQLRWELEFHIDREYFWTDSKEVFGYISNDSR